MAFKLPGQVASERLADLLSARRADRASVSDLQVRSGLESLLRATLVEGLKPTSERMVAFELEAVSDLLDKVRIDGWLVLEPRQGLTVRRPVGLEFVSAGQGVLRIASATSDRPLDQEPVRAADLTGTAWQAAIFVGRT